MFGFEVGQIYKRRLEIHGQFGGQQQGGISTPKSHPVVLAFTGSAGSQHGYDDGWSDDGVFHYFGEGQTGAMTFTGGNKGIRDHLENGKELLLFEKVRRDGSVRFMGCFSCIGFEYRDAPDTEGKMRQAIVFHLLPQTDFIDVSVEEGPLPSKFGELRKRAYQDGDAIQPGSSIETKQKAFKRSSSVKIYALKRAEGFCERCSQPAPFQTSSGNPYLEVHHITRLSDGGPDRPDRVAAICPNCHRAAHYSSDSFAINQQLLEKVGKKEAELERV